MIWKRRHERALIGWVESGFSLSAATGGMLPKRLLNLTAGKHHQRPDPENRTDEKSWRGDDAKNRRGHRQAMAAQPLHPQRSDEREERRYHDKHESQKRYAE